MKKNVASQNISAEMITAADGSDFTGTVTVLVTKDGGTQATSGGTVSHKGSGEHNYAPTQAETNADFITFTFKGTGAITAGRSVYTSFPQTVDNDTKLSKVPLSDGSITWNSTALASINTQCDTALADYDGPTNAEMVARTRPTADYFSWATDTIARVTLVDTTTTNTDMRGTDSANTVTPPTVAQFNARSLPSADYFVVSDYTAPNNTSIASILADTNELQGNQSDWATATGFNTVVPNNAGIAANNTAIAALNNISIAQIFAGGDIDTYSFEDSLKLILAANVGILAGAATNSVTIRAADNSKTRLTATVDLNGNRTAVTKDATG